MLTIICLFLLVKYKGEKYIAPLTFATASISRKKGNYISTILRNAMEDMSIPTKK